MKLFLLSLILIFGFVLTGPNADQLNQTEQILQDLHHHPELNSLGSTSDLLPRLNSVLLSDLDSLMAMKSLALQFASFYLTPFPFQNFSLSFSTSGASLSHYLSRTRLFLV